MTNGIHPWMAGVAMAIPVSGRGGGDERATADSVSAVRAADRMERMFEELQTNRRTKLALRGTSEQGGSPDAPIESRQFRTPSP